MQGHRSSLSALPENISFDHDSTSSDTDIDSQMSWNGMQASAQNHLPDCTISSNEANLQYLHHVRHERQNAEWCLGEGSSSSAQNQCNHSERKADHSWNFSSRSALTMNERQYEPSNILSLDNVNVNSNGNQTANGAFHLQDSRSGTLPQDLNMSSGFGDLEDDDCRIVERPITYSSVAPSNQHVPSSGSSSSAFVLPLGRSGYVPDSDDRPGSSLDGRRISCKRKALEIHPGQSSGAGNLNSFQNAERNHWHMIPPVPIAASNINMPTIAENNLVINNGLEHTNPRLRLGVGGAVSANPFTLTSAGTAESSRRNFRLRINGSPQQDNPFPVEANIGNRDISSSRHSSRLALHNRLFDLNPAPAVENSIPHAQYVPSLGRSPQTRWSGASSSRSSRSSASPISAQRDAAFYGEPAARNIPRSISEHPMFVPANEMGSSSQHPANWHLAGGNNSILGNVASSSRSGSGSGVNSSAPTWSRRSCPQYPRRLSEIVRRSLLSSAGTDAGGQSSNNVVRPSPSVTPREMAFASGTDNYVHHAPNTRSALLERHLEGVFGTPHSLRTLAAASEGRSSIMSEIRHVLDLMRRGEGLRFEDVMILDHSVLFGMADIHDRHRDMRLDVDNMSYEELLALEERIGNVCTGLTEEIIIGRLKQRKYVGVRSGDLVETEPCSICREEYNNGEDLGTLECGHDFHRDCVKQWLMQKNLCPICKTTGLTTI